MEVKREWLETDYYQVLGIAEDADARAITKAYRKLARELHPDKNPGDQAAEDRFKEVSAAYEVLGDDDKRAQYDEVRRYGAVGGGQPGGFTFNFDEGGGFEDLLGGLFGGGGAFTRGGPGGQTIFTGGGRAPMPGRDQEAGLRLSFEEAVRGTTTKVVVSDHSGGSRDLTVRIPAGVEDGQRIRLRGKGGSGVNGGPRGDLYVVVSVARHPRFGRRKNNLTLEVPITFPEAALGTKLSVPTLDGDRVTIKVPAGTSSGKTLRVKDRGIATTKGTGDLLVTVNVAVPQKLTSDQKKALETFAAASDESPRAHLED